MVRIAFKYRLYPNKAQEVALSELLEIARLFYNAALQERRDAYKCGISLNYYDQANQLKDIRIENRWCAALNYSATQGILRRLDKAFKMFFQRCKSGAKPGYPRFKGRDRFNSITFPSYGDGVKLKDKLYIQNAGKIRIKLHRPICGTIDTVSIKREYNKWYAVFTCEATAIKQAPAREPIGIDVGLTSFAALSNGRIIQYPRYSKIAQSCIRRCQREVSRRKKGGANRRKSVRILRKAHMHVYNQRSDFHHKVSRQLADAYGFIATEKLNIKGMVHNHCLAQSISDAGWGYFLKMLAYKVEETGGQFLQVNPNGTSQRCSECGTAPDVSKTLADRVHSCPHCGLVVDRDVNAARNILRLGLSLWDVTRENTPNVSQEAVCFS